MFRKATYELNKAEICMRNGYLIRTYFVIPPMDDGFVASQGHLECTRVKLVDLFLHIIIYDIRLGNFHDGPNSNRIAQISAFVLFIIKIILAALPLGVPLMLLE
jgi:hypothetical protein